MHKHQAYSFCRQYIYRYVRLTTKDGRTHHGYIENVDRDKVYLAIPVDSGKRDGERQFYPDYLYPGYGYPSYYPYPDYPYYPYPDYPYYPYPRRRRLRRLAIPLSLLTGVALGNLVF